jgi:hypothetical protein
MQALTIIRYYTPDMQGTLPSPRNGHMLIRVGQALWLIGGTLTHFTGVQFNCIFSYIFLNEITGREVENHAVYRLDLQQLSWQPVTTSGDSLGFVGSAAGTLLFAEKDNKLKIIL